MAQKNFKRFLITLFLLIIGSISFFFYLGFQNPKIDDNFLRTYLKQYPDAIIFKPEYLDFFTPEDPSEKQRSLEYKRKYIIKGDFNRNGKEEIAISGLLSRKADKQNNYDVFVLILEKELFGYKTLCFKKILKEPNSLIKNLFLFHDRSFGGDISIGFANNSGLVSNFTWNKGKYDFSLESDESW